MGFTAGVVGASMLGFGDPVDSRAGNAQMRGITYLSASGAVVGWVVGTVVTLPFHGHNVVGPNDVRNAAITGGAVGFMTGVAAGSLAGFKCGNGCSANSSSILTIGVSGLIGAGVGAVLGHGVGTLLPH